MEACKWNKKATQNHPLFDVVAKTKHQTHRMKWNIWGRLIKLFSDFPELRHEKYFLFGSHSMFGVMTSSPVSLHFCQTCPRRPKMESQIHIIINYSGEQERERRSGRQTWQMESRWTMFILFIAGWFYFFCFLFITICFSLRNSITEL